MKTQDQNQAAFQTYTKVVKTTWGDLALEEWADKGTHQRKLSAMYMPDTDMNRKQYGDPGTTTRK